MHPSKTHFSQAILSAAFTGTVVLVSGQTQLVQAQSLPQASQALPSSLVSLRFVPPGDAAPTSSIGGATRGNVQFSLPGSAAPQTSVGGATRGDVKFGLPGGAAPQTSVGGASRGEVRFGTPGSAAPQTTVGGGSRGDVQFGLPGTSAPSTTVGGGSRSNSSPVLTALLPETKYGYAVSGRPTFFVYVPPTSAQQIFFSLQDENGNHHYQTILEVDGNKGGVVSVTLPKDAPELAVGKNYIWFFAPIARHGILTPDNLGVTGWVKRVPSPTIGNRTDAASTVALAAEYAKEGIWYDTLAVLASAQEADPQNATLAKEWKELLEQVELGTVSTQPITQQL